MAKVKKKKKLPVSKKKKKRVPKSERKGMGKDLTASDGTKRTREGKFPKGVSGNLKGRPKGSGKKYSVAELEHDIEVVEAKEHKTFLQTWVEAAWGNASEMAAIANFMMPKLRAIEQITLAADSVSDEEAEKWRKEMYERFK